MRHTVTAAHTTTTANDAPIDDGKPLSLWRIDHRGRQDRSDDQTAKVSPPVDVKPGKKPDHGVDDDQPDDAADVEAQSPHQDEQRTEQTEDRSGCTD